MSKTLKPKVDCPQCGGCGRIDLPDEYLETLRMLQHHKVAAAGTLAGPLLVPRGTVSMRLKRMLQWGVVRIVRKEGKEKLYAAV